MSREQMMSSKRLSTLLVDVVLPLGNKLNQGNKRLTGTLGIKLSSLGEIVKIKSIDNETWTALCNPPLRTLTARQGSVALTRSHLGHSCLAAAWGAGRLPEAKDGKAVSAHTQRPV